MDHLAENAAARQRVLDLVRGMSEAQFRAPIYGDWTIGAELAHLAFWERSHLARLRRALAAGETAPAPLPDGLADIVNDAALPGWREIPGTAALALFDAAARAYDDYLASLDAPTIEAVRSGGAPRLVERFRHRAEHTDAIERGR